MMQILLIRHCQATGQEPNAPLSQEGINQSKKLALFLQNQSENIDKIISSPYTRAVDSIKPYSDLSKVPITLDNRLAERILSQTPLDNWLAILKHTFENEDYHINGGESTKTATDRAISLLKEETKRNNKTVILVTHGNLFSLILRYFNPSFGFEQWKQLSNPDVYSICFSKDKVHIERVWNL